ncbi:hypothetical protein HK101_001108 [Irineochytrium annulatum]|nr:hypothetical protein HK101_001108 [Irineochytrium annulatum]
MSLVLISFFFFSPHAEEGADPQLGSHRPALFMPEPVADADLKIEDVVASWKKSQQQKGKKKKKPKTSPLAKGASGGAGAGAGASAGDAEVKVPLDKVTGWPIEEVAGEDPPEDHDEADGIDLPPFQMKGRKNADLDKMGYVKDMMAHAWNGYREHAWGADELQPVTGGPLNWYNNYSMLNTPVDSLDTLFIMGLMKEYKEAKEALLAKNWAEMDISINVFETIIRVVGGLLAAYDLEGDERVLEKCVELVDLILPAFDTPIGCPQNQINLKSGHVETRYSVGIAEIGTLQVEFQYLSDVTGNPIYAEKVGIPALYIYEQMNLYEFTVPGLYPIHMPTDRLEFSGSDVSLGGMSDSFYEYLLKLWLSTGEPRYQEMYLTASHALAKHLIRRSADGKNTYAPYLSGYSTKQVTFEHLSCFAGGMFAIGALASKRGKWEEHFEIGRGLTDTCFMAYNSTRTGLGGESTHGESLAVQNGNYFLRLIESIVGFRPEAVESLFYMWRLTHEQKYRDWGFQVAKALNAYCRSKYGFHGLSNVDQVGEDGKSSPHAKQESFFLAETLKYLYLLFTDDDTIPLERYIFNTEAHVLSMRGHGRRKDPKVWSPLPLSKSDFKSRKLGEVKPRS